MTIDVCDEVCEPCPWRVENAHQLKKDVIKNMIENEIISPCHMVMHDNIGSKTEGVELYAEICKNEDKPFLICRGFAIARARMYRKHKNTMLMALDMKIRREEDYSRVDIVDMDYIYGEDNEQENK